MTDIMKLADEYAECMYLRREKHEARTALQSAIEALQSKLGDAIQSSAHWQHQFTEAQAENERLKVESTNKNDWLVEQRKWEAHANALQAKLDAMGKGEPVGFVAPHDLKTLREGYPATVVMLPSNKRTEPLYAAPKALAPLTDKEDWDVRGILASKLRVFHRTTEAEAEELISLFSSMKSRTPLTQPEVVEAFCNTRHNTQYISVFDAGVRFAEKHHGIGGTP